MSYSTQTKAELAQLCADRGIEVVPTATKADLVAALEEADAVNGDGGASAEPVAAKAKPEKPRTDWRPFAVSCDCPTPLAMNPAVVIASDADAAWQRFCRKNGIAGSDHKHTCDDSESAVDQAKALIAQQRQQLPADSPQLALAPDESESGETGETHDG